MRDNFLFYTTLLSDFLLSAKKFDLYSAVRPVSRSARSSKTCYRPVRLVNMLDSILSVFSDVRLLSHLQVMETALTSLEAYSAGAGMGRGPSSATGGDMGSTPVRTTPLRLPIAHSATGDGGYSNCGPLLRAQILALEGKAGYSPAFVGTNGSEIYSDVSIPCVV